MAGTATYTERSYGSVKLLKCAWTSSAGGVVSGTASSVVYDGKLLAVATDPSATAPTDDYDVTVLDDNSMDVLLGAGANRDTADTEYLLEANLGAVAQSTLTVTIANAGSVKLGTVYIWIR
jgi:hypothetical protein